MKSAFLQLLRRAGIDRAVGYTVFANGWAFIAGPLTLLLLTRFLSPDELGFYYTSSNVLAGMVLFELGLSYVLLQVASHEWARLDWGPSGTLTGDAEAKARLASLFRISLLWYGVAAALMGLIILPAGYLYFQRYIPASAHVAWQYPWIWIALVSVGSMILTPILAILEGCGLVAQLSLLRLRQGMLGNVGQWAALSLGWGLYAAPLYGTLSLLSACVWIVRHQRPFMREMAARPGPMLAGLNWRQEVWPFQWRIALSGISSYVILQTFLPVLLATHGAAAAGRLGLSLSIMQTVGGVAMAWLATKSSPFGVLIAQRDWARLDQAFFATLWRSLVVVIAGVLMVWGMAEFLHQIGHPLSRRLLSPLPLGLLAAATVVSHVVGAEALYLRVHKQEPFLVLSLTVAALMGLSNGLLARPLGSTGMMLGYFLVYLLVGLGGGTWIFARKRREWHAPTEDEEASYAHGNSISG